jgi:diguanylate cyclase (GGDEF)-like protein
MRSQRGRIFGHHVILSIAIFEQRFQFHRVRERLPEPFPLPGAGGKHVTRQFQPQDSETQAASRNPRGSTCWIKAQQYGSELSLLMIDVDHFKLFNDTYGHPEGDVYLGRLGETLAAIAANTMGFAGRYGGEEFCLPLPNTESRRAQEIGEIVRAGAEPGDASLHLSLSNITLSVGVACAKPNDGQKRPGDLIEAADDALYAAKHRGRSAVVRWRPRSGKLRLCRRPFELLGVDPSRSFVA